MLYIRVLSPWLLLIVKSMANMIMAREEAWWTILQPPYQDMPKTVTTVSQYFNSLYGYVCRVKLYEALHKNMVYLRNKSKQDLVFSVELNLGLIPNPYPMFLIP